MKNLLLLPIISFFFLLTYAFPLQAQFRLQVDGDGQLSGNLTVGTDVLFSNASGGSGRKLIWSNSKAAFRAGALGISQPTYWDYDSLGLYSFATGFNPRATNMNSFVGGGSNNRASGSSSFVGGGGSNVAYGISSFVGGGGSCTASGNFSFSGGGIGNVASGNNSFVGGGFSLLAKSYAEVAFGTYNEDYTPASTGAFNATDRLFVIGNGTGTTNRSNAVTVLKNGNVGIGISTPPAKLAVNGNFQLSGPSIPIGLTRELFGGNSPIINLDINLKHPDKDPAELGAAFRIDARNNATYGLFQWLYRPADGTESIILRLLPDGTLNSNGSIIQNANLIHSDKAFKQNITPIKNPLDALEKLRGVSYTYRNKAFKDRNFYEGRQLGLIAQEVEMVFPELVKELKDGYKAVNYDGLIPVLIEAVKEQQAAIEEKEERIRELETKLARIDKLESLLAKAEALEAKIAVLDQLENKIAQLENSLEQCCQSHQDLLEQPMQNSSMLPREGAYLKQNSPNPFYRQTIIEYYLPAGIEQAEMWISDLSGQLLRSFRLQQDGPGRLEIDAQLLTPGTYLYTLVSDGQIVDTKKMVLTN